MNTHDIDTGLPHVAFCRVSDVDPHESHHRQLGVSADTRLYTEDQVRTAIEADRKRIAKLRASGSCAVCGSRETELHTRCLECNAETVNYEQSRHNKMTHADRKRRGELVGYVDPVVIEWLAEPKRTAAATMATTIHKARTIEGLEPIFTAPQPAEPVKVPSDDLQTLQMMRAEYDPGNGPMSTLKAAALDAAIAALLARYGQPADWQDFQK